MDSKEPSSTMLYVSNLPFQFEDADLKGVFNGFEVASAYVATRRNGRSKGFGFVTFTSPDQQKKALAAVDGKELEGRALTVKVAHKDDRRDAKGELKEEFKSEAPARKRRGNGGDNNSNNGNNNGNNNNGNNNNNNNGNKDGGDRQPSETVVYVSNLPFEFSDADLLKVFAAHKPVSARIARRRNERSKGFGFVEFANANDQKSSLALDGTTIEERQISVKVSVAGGRDKAANGGNNANNNNNSNKNNSNNNSNNNNNNNGNNANNNGDNKEGKKKRRRPAKKESGGNADAPAQAPKDDKSAEPSDTTVYVANLPFELSDKELGELFSSKGHKVVSAHVARKRDERSKGFGFVQLASNKDQQAALALDGQNLQDRQLSVKVAKKGSEQRAKDVAGGNNNNNSNNNNNNNNNNNRNNNNNNNNNNNGGNNNNNNNGGNNNAAGGENKEKRKRNRNRKGEKEGGDAPTAAARPKEKKSSETLVYVANLSFDVDDNALAKLFDGFSIKSAHVAVRRNGRSKGFGFVEFATRADQQKALIKSGQEHNGRQLTVEVANEKTE